MASAEQVAADLVAIRALIQSFPGGFAALDMSVKSALQQWFVQNGGINVAKASPISPTRKRQAPRSLVPPKRVSFAKLSVPLPNHIQAGDGESSNGELCIGDGILTPTRKRQAPQSLVPPKRVSVAELSVPLPNHIQAGDGESSNGVLCTGDGILTDPSELFSSDAPRPIPVTTGPGAGGGRRRVPSTYNPHVGYPPKLDAEVNLLPQAWSDSDPIPTLTRPAQNRPARGTFPQEVNVAVSLANQSLGFCAALDDSGHAYVSDVKPSVLNCDDRIRVGDRIVGIGGRRRDRFSAQMLSTMMKEALRSGMLHMTIARSPADGEQKVARAGSADEVQELRAIATRPSRARVPSRSGLVAPMPTVEAKGPQNGRHGDGDSHLTRPVSMAAFAGYSVV